MGRPANLLWWITSISSMNYLNHGIVDTIHAYKKDNQHNPHSSIDLQSINTSISSICSCSDPTLIKQISHQQPLCITHNLLWILTKFVVFMATTVEHAYIPAKLSAVPTNRRAFHCLPVTRIANAVDARAKAKKTFFHAWKALTTLLHPLQWTTCRKYRFAGFGACIVPIPPLAGEEAESPATKPAGACSTTAGCWGSEMVLCPKW